ncbi:MAG: bifunctional 5,10-methylene-tetrahydrofolate dehydrogenase/5,10-methylene-tetrahydrofolate cyclohydrolase [Deltaproteobacteria bacterium]|nr:MAG: bifunctional 5,10-methylene-tetrahydrofolate dehydrogenase/5,10-methylene-tetrahydrofolate cyclohydrolase [Deltaproteobacteria bacterium]
MEDKIISGSKTARKIYQEIREKAVGLAARGVVPGLVTILAGDDPASISYVAAKNKTARELGFASTQINLDRDTGQQELLQLIDKYNLDDLVDGILVQLPLPPQMDESKIIGRIDPAKDVDGFHPVNAGKMMLGARCFLPCTPRGILELLVRNGVETSGAEVVVIGRSNIVGKPVANLMLQKRYGGNATVTVCHTGTKNLAAHCRRADILIAAVGMAGFVTADMVKKGCVVIDVGVNRVGQTKDGRAVLAGDVDFAEVVKKAGKITPVPGGVGPMTIAMLMQNTLQSAMARADMQK